MIARFARKTETLGRAKRKGVGGKEFLPALAFSPPQFFLPAKLARHLYLKSFFDKQQKRIIIMSKNRRNNIEFMYLFLSEMKSVLLYQFYHLF